MPQRWKSILLSLFAVSLLSTSCNRKYSSDDPLPTTYAPSVIVGSDNQVVYAFDPSNGAKNWELAFAFPIKASPIVYGGMVYIASSLSDTVYKINAKTGVVAKKIVPTPHITNSILATPVADANLLYVATTAGYLYAYDTGTGTLKWYYSTLGESIESSPVVYNGKIYFATTAGSVFCLDKTVGGIIPTGGSTQEVWAIHNIPYAKFYSSPSVSAPYLYLGSYSDSNMYCIYLDVPQVGSSVPNGEIRWTYKTKGNIYSSPAAYGGTCVFGCNDFRIYCLDTSLPLLATSPEARWIDSANSQVRSSPVIYNQVVYVGSDDYYLYALNIINGGIKWKFRTRGLIKSSPLPYKNTIFIGSYDRNLYAVDTATGTAKWSKTINGEIFCSPVLDDLIKVNGYNSQVSGFTN